MRPADDKQHPANLSRTALGVAALRAAHRWLDTPPYILDDPIALTLLGEQAAARVISRGQGSLEPLMENLRAHVLLRSRYAEDCLAVAAGRGVRQYVMLGAGYDTFAWRQPGWAGNLRIYEVDHPDTQGHKLHRLRAAALGLPGNAEFVGIDFQTTSLHDGLRSSSLDFQQPAFFSCLGVLMYLTPNAVRSVFKVVAGFAPGSQIAFTFGTPEQADSELAMRARAMGEPWLSAFTPAELTAQLLGMGFSQLEFLTPQVAQQRYFQGRTDTLKAPPNTNIAMATVG